MASHDRVIEPVIAADGSAHYSSTTSPSSDTSPAICYQFPMRVIPVIFVSGIMGSNLMNLATKGPVWLLNSKLGMAKWLRRGSSTRKVILDPRSTTVYDGGTIPQGTIQSDAELKRRGWGEVANMSYGDFLVWLENALHDVYRPGTDYGRQGLRAQLMKKAVTDELNLTSLSYDEVRLSYRYLFPVHAVGYNWLQDNAVSAVRLHERIEYFMDYYRRSFGYMCEKVILVTHSMGGLVARHYSEVLNHRDKVLGIVHGVMPATGAAAAYKRAKAGTSGVPGLIVGTDAAEVTAVFAQSPGALQLLPTKEYGNGWLQIRDGDQFVSLPVTDPYDEIYLQRKKWWGLVSDPLLNPLDNQKVSTDQDWAAFAKLIQREVRPFHIAINGKYHANTYVFYGDDPQLKTWGNVAWRRARPQSPGFWSVPPIPLSDELNKSAAYDSGMGSQTVEVPSYGWRTRNEFVLQDADENGDGTVPRRSGAASSQYANVCVPYSGVKHEAAYTKEPQQLFALWAITKIAFSVRHTSMAYKDFK